MKRFLRFIILTALITIFFTGCTNIKVKDGKIPFLPIAKDNVFYIGLYGYSEEKKCSNNRNAEDEEKGSNN